ncbi:hypothetical protein EV363DRAFT_1175844 [Boletus edulis]|nr:hypothetical protein EV363DRAFT_1175844 [Boletus edulis]
MQKLRLDAPVEYHLLQDAPVVFGKRRLRDLYNDVKAKQYARLTNQQYHTYLSINKIDKIPVHGDNRLRLSLVRSTGSKDTLGRLLLIPGMPVMVTENLSIENKVVNGSQGTIKDIIYRVVPEGREVVCAYVKITSSPLTLDGLQEAVVPIFPKTQQFTYSPVRGNRIHISRTQLPLVPTWVFTDYKAQGTLMLNVMVDLTSARGIQHAYVMLSRATGLQHVGVLHWFPSHRIFTRLQQDLRNELQQLQQLDEKTCEWFNNTHPTPTRLADSTEDTTSMTNLEEYDHQVLIDFN